MSLPDPNIYMVEYWLELGVAGHLTTLGVWDVFKQRDDKGLITPRVEVKTIWDGWLEHRFTAPNKGVYFDMGRGKMIFKCVTRRNDTSQSHVRLVGTIRYAMQLIFATPGYTPGNPGPQTLSDHLPYHRIGRLIDTGATPSFTPNEMQDVTAMSFDFEIQIRQEKFPQT